MGSVTAHCHLGLGRLHRCGGELGRFGEYFVKALAMYRDMDMDFWLDQAQSKMEAS